MEIRLTEKYECSTRTFAKLIGRTDERVRQMTKEGELEAERKGNRFVINLIPSLQMYMEYLRNQNKASGEMDAEARKAKADADWKEAKAEIEEMKRDELRGTLHAAEDVEAITTDLIMAVRSQLLALPGTLAINCAEAKTAREAAGIIKKEVNGILNSLTEYKYDPEKYEKAVRERESWMMAEGQEMEEE